MMKFTKWQAAVIIAAGVVTALLTDWGHYKAPEPVEFTGDTVSEAPMEEDMDMPDEQQPAGDEGSAAFGLTMSCPDAGWSFYDNTGAELPPWPAFNCYREDDLGDAELPLTHFGNQTHVSVYPEGIPTEGLLGQNEPFSGEVGFLVDSERSFTYVLEDGTPFAHIIRPAMPPAAWQEHGYIWMRVAADDYEAKCLRDGEEVTDNTCSPFAGDDEIIHTGSVNSDLWDETMQILQSIRLES